MQYLHHEMVHWQSPSVDMLQGELTSHPPTHIIRNLEMSARMISNDDRLVRYFTTLTFI